MISSLYIFRHDVLFVWLYFNDTLIVVKITDWTSIQKLQNGSAHETDFDSCFSMNDNRLFFQKVSTESN